MPNTHRGPYRDGAKRAERDPHNGNRQIVVGEHEAGLENERSAVARIQAAVPQLPIRRDAIFRRLLAVADLGAAAVGLALAAVVTQQPLVLASIATLPLIVLIMKIGGRYDHDEVVLRKAT